MPLKKIQFTPGVNRESTSYAAEGTWYTCDKVRFRSGYPEKIGGWTRVRSSAGTYNTFSLGTARSMICWGTIAGYVNTGIGTNLKYYVENDGTYYDITPVRLSLTLGANPFTSSSGLPTVTVAHTAHGAVAGDYVTFSGATTFAGIPAVNLNKEFAITSITGPNAYVITLSVNATSGTTGGGSAVVAAYQAPVGSATASINNAGWGAGTWGGSYASGAPSNIGWGTAISNVGLNIPIRIWTHHNYGQNLLYSPRGGSIYYWDASNLPTNYSNRGILLSAAATTAGYTGADVPLTSNKILVSEVHRIGLVFGTNAYLSTTYDPMQIRWSDQDNIFQWTPAITNQAGGVRLSSGTKIITAASTKQEIVVWTDSSVYSMQYVGAPYVWSLSMLADNVSIISPQCATPVNNVMYWMGADKFYMYSGRVETLPCSVRGYVFGDINRSQLDQVVCGTNEGYAEIWWFYPSSQSNINDRYVVFNHLDKVWYYGTMQRTAWLDSGIRQYPMGIKDNAILFHENGNDDGSTATATGIDAYIESADFDIDDGDRFGFIRRMIPDLSFSNSTSINPAATIVLKPKAFSGESYGAEPPQSVVRSYQYPVEQYTTQVYVRVRGRQMAFRIESDALGTWWQLGATRYDIRPDGRKT